MRLLAFSAQFIKIISHYKKLGYNINVMQQTVCLVVKPIIVGKFAFLFNCTPAGRTSDLRRLRLALTVGFLLLRCSVVYTVEFIYFIFYLYNI